MSNTSLSEVDELVLDATNRIFQELCGPEVVDAHERGDADSHLWNAISESGLPYAWIDEASGGVGCSLSATFAIIKAAARCALPVPLAETLMANRLAAQAGLPCVDSATLYADADQRVTLADAHLFGSTLDIPFLTSVERLLLVVQSDTALQLVTLSPANIEVESDRSIAGEACGRLHFDNTVPDSITALPPTLTITSIRAFEALVRAHQIVGALDTVLALTASYVQERQQFGRPLIKFQAVQAMVADLAAETALTHAAVDDAARLSGTHEIPSQALIGPIASAKCVAGETAGSAAKLAHQAHGAMGFSAEYSLSQYTRRLWAWRDAAGNETEWARWLGRDAHGQPSAWQYVSQNPS